jgi:hypothetical protein
MSSPDQTSPADSEATPERKHRTKKRGGLFVTDAELIEKLGVPEKIARQTLRALDREPRSGFPAKQKLWGGRRYWPAVEKWLELTGGLVKLNKNGAADR